MSGDETFLKRWSRLKRERREEAKAAPEPGANGRSKKESKPPPAKDAAPAEAEEGDPKVVAELPPIDSLGKDSDYSPFMRKGVPQALRLAALRKLWASDPVLAAPDPLDFHNVDYTHLAAPGQVVKTTYQAGRGFVDAVEKTADKLAGADQPGGVKVADSKTPDSNHPDSKSAGSNAADSKAGGSPAAQPEELDAPPENRKPKGGV